MVSETLILQTTNLQKKYGDRMAVDGLNLNVRKGDVYGFLGPNGAGKSTTIRMLLTLIRPTGGNISIFGKELTSNRREILSKVGSIVEKPDFYKYLSAEKNLSIFSAYSGIKSDKKKIYELLDFVGLKGREKSEIKTYSHGMKQRLGIAQALLNDPELIILDEPTTGLDPKGIIELRNLILELQNRGKTIFLSSHILSEIELIASRMVIINQGKAVAEGNVEELISKNDLNVSIKIISDFQNAISIINNSIWASKIIGTDLEHHFINFHISELETAEINQWLVSQNIMIGQITSKTKLEDLFLQLTKEAVPA